MSLDDEWNDFIENPDSFQPSIIESTINDNIKLIAKCTDIYISTKTKIVYLNQAIDIYDVFWKIAIINYDDQEPRNKPRSNFFFLVGWYLLLLKL